MLFIDIAIKGQLLTATPSDILVAKTVGVKARVDLDPEWDGDSVTLVFATDRVQKSVLYSGSEVEVPWEVLDLPGSLRISAVGVGEGTRRPTAFMKDPLKIVLNGKIEGGQPEDYSPALWEQVLQKMDEAGNSAVRFMEDVFKYQLVSTPISAIQYQFVVHDENGEGGSPSGTFVSRPEHQNMQMYVAFFKQDGTRIAQQALGANIIEFSFMSNAKGVTLAIRFRPGFTHVYALDLDTNECKFMGSSQSKTVQPDWNENDPESDNYIKNRPFYEEVEPKSWDKTVTLEWLEETEFPETLGVALFENTEGLEIINGVEYTVTWDDTEYKVAGILQDGAGLLGDLEQGPFSEKYPFLIQTVDYPVGDDSEDSIPIVGIIGPVGDHSVSIHWNDSNIKKIDSKYIDGEIVRDLRGKELTVSEFLNYPEILYRVCYTTIGDEYFQPGLLIKAGNDGRRIKWIGGGISDEEEYRILGEGPPSRTRDVNSLRIEYFGSIYSSLVPEASTAYNGYFPIIDKGGWSLKKLSDAVGGIQWVIDDEYDWSSGTSGFTYTRSIMSGIRELVFIWEEIENDSSEDGYFTVRFNNIINSLGYYLIPIAKKGSGRFGYTWARYNGLFWTVYKSNGSTGPVLPTPVSPLNATVYVSPGNPGPSDRLEVMSPYGETKAVRGILKVYGGK